jgi:hypothetical protein
MKAMGLQPQRSPTGARSYVAPGEGALRRWIRTEVVQESPVFRESLRSNAGVREEICSPDSRTRTAAARGENPPRCVRRIRPIRGTQNLAADG